MTKPSDRRTPAVLLFVIGLLLLIMAVVLRVHPVPTSEIAQPGSPRSVTFTRESISDVSFSALLAVGGALLLCGVFYIDIVKVRFLGVALELAKSRREVAELLAQAPGDNGTHAAIVEAVTEAADSARFWDAFARDALGDVFVKSDGE